MVDIVYSSLIDMAESVRAGKVSPVELVDAHLSRIRELSPKLNAFVTVDSDGARDQAKLAEAAMGSGGKSKSIGPPSRRTDLNKKLYRCRRAALRMRKYFAKGERPLGGCAAGEKAARSGRHHSGKH